MVLPRQRDPVVGFWGSVMRAIRNVAAQTGRAVVFGLASIHDRARVWLTIWLLGAWELSIFT